MKTEKAIGSMATALSNHLILQNIFSFLSYRDVISCSLVNEFWRPIATPMICYFQVTMSLKGYASASEITVADYEGKNHKHYHASCLGLANLLRSSSKAQKSIELEIKDLHFQLNFSQYIPFLTEFGRRVVVFTYESSGVSVDVQRYRNFLSYFPNLVSLRSSDLYLTGLTSVNINSIKMNNLRFVNFGKNVNSKAWEYVLSHAPNLKRIFGFPVELILVLYEYPHSEAAKSLLKFGRQEDYDPHTGIPVRISMPRLHAITGPRLRRWSEPPEPKLRIATTSYDGTTDFPALLEKNLFHQNFPNFNPIRFMKTFELDDGLE